MTLQTWKQISYPIDASETQEEEAASHSLRKWIGLRPESLTEHGLYKNASAIFPFVNDRQVMFIDDSSCALCYHHLNAKNEPTCENCPLYKELGGHACDGTEDSPYGIWKRTGDPEPMIAALTNIIVKREKELD